MFEIIYSSKAACARHCAKPLTAERGRYCNALTEHKKARIFPPSMVCPLAGPSQKDLQEITGENQPNNLPQASCFKACVHTGEK